MATQKITLDAAQSIFFTRELEQIEQKLYETKYAELEAEMLLPNRVQLDPGVETYTWRLFDKRAKAVPFAGHEDGAPTSDVDGSEESAKVMSFVDAYRYNVREIAAAKYAGRPLDTMRAEATRRSIAQELNTLALLGRSVDGIKGLFTQTSTLSYTVPNGAGASPLWTLKTADEILTDLFGMVDGIPDNTLDIESPKRLLLPKASIRYISTKRLGTSASDTTVLEFFKAQRPNIQVMGANYLPTAGAGGVKRAVVYDPSQVSWLMSFPYQQMPVEQEGFTFVINAEGRGGGVVTPFPKSMLYADGF